MVAHFSYSHMSYYILSTLQSSEIRGCFTQSRTYVRSGWISLEI